MMTSYMKSTFRIELELTDSQRELLDTLQTTFAAACNALAPRVAEQRCWNRVTLHHLSYHELRTTFPDLGSQMACNAIYAVCRAGRLVYQHPKSPANVNRLGAAPLPRLKFNAQSPVYFDRHTLSLKAREVSLFTQGGRIRCPISLSPQMQRRLITAKLREVLLTRQDGTYALTFVLADPPDAPAPTAPDAGTWPEHLSVLGAHDPAAEPRLN